MDLNDLERHLAKERAKGASARRMIGFFTAASSITGVLADDVATTLLLGQYGALSVWDYTSAGKTIEQSLLQPIVPFVIDIPLGKLANYKPSINGIKSLARNTDTELLSRVSCETQQFFYASHFPQLFIVSFSLS